ncbi:MAG: quinone-dependent dihydroorotate dehydrogenase [Bacteroidales bacterium]|nr:quinone-dependent dihydroorotate dehydrogenase [Bacteroidales bacterium]
MYKHLIRPFLFSINAEAAHNFVLSCIKFIGSLPLGRNMLRLKYSYKAPNLAREVFGIQFKNPVGLAAGFDKNAEVYNEMANMGFSFVEIGSLTLQPQDGNPKPRLKKEKKNRAIINRMGLNNKGIRHAINRLKTEKPQTIICASLAKNTTSTYGPDIIRDFSKSFSLMYDFCDMFAINISYSAANEGIQDLQDISFMSDIVDPILELRLCYEEYKPILLKLSPDIPFDQVDEIIDWCMISGIDGIIATNSSKSLSGLKLNDDKRELYDGGSVSGDPIYNRSLAMVKHIHQHTKGRLPIVGVGGIMTPAQAKEMLDSGASLVELSSF